jgi:hypothetical protein
MRLAVVLHALTDEAFRVLKETHPDWHIVPQGDRVLEAYIDSDGPEAALEMLKQQEAAAGGAVVAVGAYEAPGGPG